MQILTINDPVCMLFRGKAVPQLFPPLSVPCHCWPSTPCQSWFHCLPRFHFLLLVNQYMIVINHFSTVPLIVWAAHFHLSFLIITITSFVLVSFFTLIFLIISSLSCSCLLRSGRLQVSLCVIYLEPKFVMEQYIINQIQYPNSLLNVYCYASVE